jgi:hypothetical protein
MNGQSIAALLLLVLLLSRSRFAASRSSPAQPPSKQDFLAIAGIALLAVLAFLRTAQAPLLHDSYSHVWAAARRSWPETFQIFYAHPASGDFFYRPLGYLTISLDSKWAYSVPTRWHAWSMALHAVNSCLVYCFARALPLTRLPSLAAGLVFALHGSRPEAVSWVAARFDLLAAFFVLVTLLSVREFARTGKLGWVWMLLVFSVVALLSKESAYCLPLLVLGMLAFEAERAARRRTLIASICVTLSCFVLFLYRLWLLGGIGGYKTAAGQPTILHFSLLRTVNPDIS